MFFDKIFLDVIIIKALIEAMKIFLIFIRRKKIQRKFLSSDFYGVSFSVIVSGWLYEMYRIVGLY